MRMPGICFILLEIALEYFQHILQAVWTFTGVDAGSDSGKTVKIKIHVQSSLGRSGVSGAQAPL